MNSLRRPRLASPRLFYFTGQSVIFITIIKLISIWQPNKNFREAEFYEEQRHSEYFSKEFLLPEKNEFTFSANPTKKAVYEKYFNVPR